MSSNVEHRISKEQEPKEPFLKAPPRDQHTRAADAHTEAELPEGGCEAHRSTQCPGMGDEGDASCTVNQN